MLISLTMLAQESILQLMSNDDEAEVLAPAWFAQLKAHIDYLIVHDFQKLVQVLYRVDVSEKLLKRTLEAANGAHASDIIATLLCQRQVQKIKTRRDMTQRANDIPDDEKW